MLLNTFKLKHRPTDRALQSFLHVVHVDSLLFLLLLLLSIAGLFILYSASGQSVKAVIYQGTRLLFSFGMLFIIAQIPPSSLQRLSPWLYFIGITALAIVLIIGHIGKGAQRWLTLGIIRIQPAELMKLAIPLFLAWYYHRKALPITLQSALTALPIILIPAFLTAKQPDLGTSILLVIAGASVVFLAGLNMKTIYAGMSALILCVPFAWYFLHDYQRNRILTFINPERDPLGTGYHIIQSKIAIGSGGLFGKGFLNGTQSNLHFLPERSTDFIFAVFGEEFGMIGGILLITLYFLIILRGLYITLHAQDTFSRLLAGSISFTFFVSFFINMGMVIGILPVVGIPLPLISYGGSSMMTIMASFGMLMSIQTHRKLVST